MIWRRLLLGVVALAIVGAFAMVLTPFGREALSNGVGWLRAAGSEGKLIAVAMIVGGIPFGLPSLWLAALAGYLFGEVTGILLAIPAVLAGATLAFLMARWLFAADVERLILRRPKWTAVNTAVGKGGWRIVALMRLFLPHNLLNLALGATAVSTKDFMLGTFIGSSPNVSLAALCGALVTNAAELWQALEKLGIWKYVVLAVSGVALVTTAIWIRNMAKRAIERAAAD